MHYSVSEPPANLAAATRTCRGCRRVVLAVAMLGGPRWIGARAWIAAAALLVWEAGAIAVWLVAYHAPNPAGRTAGRGYTSKFIELLNVLVLLTIVRLSFLIRQPAAAPRTP